MELRCRVQVEELFREAGNPVPKFVSDAPPNRVFCFGYDPVMRLTLPLHPWGYQIHGLYLQDQRYKRPTHGYPVFISPLPIVDEGFVDVTDILSGVEVPGPARRSIDAKNRQKHVTSRESRPVMFLTDRTRNVATRTADVVRQGEAWAGTLGTGRQGGSGLGGASNGTDWSGRQGETRRGLDSTGLAGKARNG